MERSNSFVSNVVRSSEYETPEELEQLINFVYNDSFNRRLGFSPNELKNKESYSDTMKRKLEIDHKTLEATVERENLKEFQNSRTHRSYSYQVNYKVWVRRSIKSKAERKFEGPYQILEISQGKHRLKLNTDRSN